jgi:hypothetical protein
MPAHRLSLQFIQTARYWEAVPWASYTLQMPFGEFPDVSGAAAVSGLVGRRIGICPRKVGHRVLEIPGSSGLADQYGLFFEESGQKTFLRC